MAAFTPIAFFAIAYKAGATSRLVSPQQNVVNVSVVATYGAASLPLVLSLGSSTLTGSITSEAHQAFKLTWVSSVANTRNCTLEFDPVGFAGLNSAIQAALVNAFDVGGRLVMDVERPGSPGVFDKLAIELRRLQSGDFVVNAAGTSASPALYAGAAGSNLPAGSGAFTYRVTALGGAVDLVSDASGVFTVTQAAAPADTTNLTLTVTSTINNVDNGLGGLVTVGPLQSTLSIDLHLATECMLLLDRSGSMSAVASSGNTKWQEAVAAANLFSTLYGNAIAPLAVGNVGLIDQHKLAMGRFRTQAGFDAQYLPAAGFAAATPAIALGVEAPGGGTPIGQALVDAAGRFTAGAWRRRHMFLLSDGMSNQGAPPFGDVFANPAAYLPSIAESANAGITLHAVSYTLPAETSVVSLSALVSHYGGEFHGTGAEKIDLDPNALREMYLNVLSDIIPVDRAEIPAGSTLVEDGLDRVIFVATTNTPINAVNADAAKAALPGGSTTSAGQGSGYSWAIADSPLEGTWNVTAPAGAATFALYDLSLRMRTSVTAPGLGQPIRVAARLTFKGAPVCGADLVVALRGPGESAGELTTKFAQRGGLVKAVRRGTLSTSVLTSGLTSTHVAVRREAAQILEADKSVRRQLVDAAEEARNLGLQLVGHSLSLQEVEPGLYVAEFPASMTAEEGLYSFRVRGHGLTPSGKPFVRDCRSSVVLAPVPDPKHSETSLVKSAALGGKVTWTANVLPRTATGRPVGPGMGADLVFMYVEPKDRKALPALTTVDHLDGTYGVQVDLDEKLAAPSIGLYYLPVGAAAPAVVVKDQHAVRKVKVTLDRIQVLDDKDPCLMGKGELEFDAIVAPNANPHRAVRTRIPEKGALELSSGEAKDVRLVIFEGLVEEDATLSVTVGGKELDWLLFFEREEKLARYHRVLELSKGSQSLVPGDERIDAESMSDWKLWYTVDVS